MYSFMSKHVKTNSKYPCPQDDEERWGNHPDAVRTDDGQLRLKHVTKYGEKLETVSEREARLQHNMYVKFSRTFDSS